MAWYKLVEYLYRFFSLLELRLHIRFLTFFQALVVLYLFILRTFIRKGIFFIYYLIVEKIDLIIRKKEKYELFKITSNLNLAIFYKKLTRTAAP